MQCNIDARGKALRLIAGVMVLVVGLVILTLGFTDIITGTWVWVLAGLMIAMGSFAIFESRQGWCVVRAMGFKTPI